jgi:hypothetical protein
MFGLMIYIGYQNKNVRTELLVILQPHEGVKPGLKDLKITMKEARYQKHCVKK